MIHAVVIQQAYLDLMLAGIKTVESRLSLNRVEPFGAVQAGERLFFKASGGTFQATAVARRVTFVDGLTPRRVSELRRVWNDRVLGEPSYWRAKSRARYATLIELGDVEPAKFGPSVPAFHGRAWRVLPDAMNIYPACLHESIRGRRAG